MKLALAVDLLPHHGLKLQVAFEFLEVFYKNLRVDDFHHVLVFLKSVGSVVNLQLDIGNSTGFFQIDDCLIPV